MRKDVFLTLMSGLVLSVSTGFAVPQNATAPQGRPEWRQQGPQTFGTITSVGVDRFEVKKNDGTTQTVMVNDQTHYREGQREAPKELKLEDLKPGDHVMVRGQLRDSKELVASGVFRVTEEQFERFQNAGGGFQNAGERTGGEIVAIENNQLKVRNPQGEKTIVLNDQTTFMKDGQPITLKDLKVGDRIFALGKETNGQFVATRVMSGQFQFRRGPGGGGGGGGRRERKGPENQ